MRASAEGLHLVDHTAWGKRPYIGREASDYAVQKANQEEREKTDDVGDAPTNSDLVGDNPIQYEFAGIPRK